MQFSKISTKDYYWGTSGPYRCDANITEVVIYGKPIGKKPVKPTTPPSPDFGISVGSFIGANVFTWDKPESFTNIGFAREYHDWDKTDNMAYPDNKCMFWSDTWYKSVVDSGITINLNLKSNTNYTDVTKPAKGSTTDPNSYAAHADHMFQLAARYGSTVVPSSLLEVQENNKKSGLNYVKYYEDWNEPNNWWAGAASNFSPYEQQVIKRFHGTMYQQ